MAPTAGGRPHGAQHQSVQTLPWELSGSVPFLRGARGAREAERLVPNRARRRGGPSMHPSGAEGEQDRLS